jgi:hypothetical protein
LYILFDEDKRSFVLEVFKDDLRIKLLSIDIKKEFSDALYLKGCITEKGFVLIDNLGFVTYISSGKIQ